LCPIAHETRTKPPLLAVGCKLRGGDYEQTFNGDVARCSRALHLVAGRQSRLAEFSRAYPFHSHLPYRQRVDDLGAKVSRRRRRPGMDANAAATNPHLGRCHLVLFAETDLAPPPHLHLSAVECRSGAAACLCP